MLSFLMKNLKIIKETFFSEFEQIMAAAKATKYQWWFQSTCSAEIQNLTVLVLVT